jgi:DNA repair protein RadD
MTPWYFQTLAKNSIFEYFDAGNKGNPLVCMPTGTGKSIVIADFLRDVFMQHPNQRVLMLTHVWKLIVQNAEKMQKMWPTVPLGIHSAGLNSRDVIMPIVFGGVQSVVKNIEALGHRDLLLIDEAHLLNDDDDTNYKKVINGLLKINPYLKVVGFTATPYRMKKGMLTDGGLFTDIASNFCTHEWFSRLIAEGYMCPLIGKPTNTRISGISNLQVLGGEFNQKQAEELVDTDEIVNSACRELLEFGYNRNKCMVFAAGINNSEHISAVLNEMGASAVAVHSKLTQNQIKERLDAYSAGEYWAVVGANMLTTGYDEPSIDIIADFQATCSPGKHVQKLGRGTRIHPSKSNTLYLDFVGNVARNGPIDDPVLPRKPGQPTGEVPVKICTTDKLIQASPGFAEIEGCGAYNHASARNCCNCAAEFSFASKVQETAYTDSPMKQETNPVYDIKEVRPPVFYRKNMGKMVGTFQKPPYIRATYMVGARSVNLNLFFEHTGKAKRLATEWWQKHSPNPPPQSCDEFLARTNELRVPTKVMIHSNLPYPEIVNYEF